MIELRLAVPKLSILDGAIMLTDVNLNVFGTQSTAESELRTYVFNDDGGESGGESGGEGGTYMMTQCSLADDVAEEEEGACAPSPPATPTSPLAQPPQEHSPHPPKSLTSPPLPPPSGVCSTVNMVAGCKCANQGFGHGKSDNPLVSTGLCCDESTKQIVTGAQMQSSVKCVKHSPPPWPPPPMPPPPSQPPGDVCSKDNMVAGCKCASQGFGNGKPDNPPSTSPLCCNEATRKTITGAQMMTSNKCVKYSPPPRPPPPMPPPPSPPPADVCSKDKMIPGCKCASDGFSHGKPDNPLASTGLCCSEVTKKTVTGAQMQSSVKCVEYSPPPRPPPPMPPPPSPPPTNWCSKDNFFEVGRCISTASNPS